MADRQSPARIRRAAPAINSALLRMEGFIVMDHVAQDGAALRALRGWVESGQVRVFADIIDGLKMRPRH